MKVYRVENKNGDGPYTAAGYRFINKYYSDHYHPSIQQENYELYKTISNNMEEYFFGFENIESLYNWFFDDDHNEELREDFGCVVCCYKVPENKVIKFKKQLVFKRGCIKSLYKIKLHKPGELIL